MLQLVNDRALMGKYANGRIYNMMAWAIVAALILLTAILAITALFPRPLS